MRLLSVGLVPRRILAPRLLRSSVGIPVLVEATWVAITSDRPVKRCSRAILPIVARIVAFNRFRSVISRTSGLSLATPFGEGSAEISEVSSSTMTNRGLML